MSISDQNHVLLNLLIQGISQTTVHGVLIFGSTARNPESFPGDMDTGLIYSGRKPEFDVDASIDLFLWSMNRWQNGFPLQLELAKDAVIYYDPDEILKQKLDFIRREILPDWESSLRRIYL